MTMMDTRVGPGADISDEDLDFAVGVKLRLDAGEEVPDADLDRAVAIKLKHFPPATATPAAAPATATVRGLMGPQQIPHVAVPPPTPDQAAAQQGQLLQDLNARYGNPDAPPNPSNVSLGEGGYTAQPPQRGMLSEMGNAFQAGVQGLEAGIGRAGAAVGDVARGLGFDALGAQLQQGRSGGLVPAAGAPSQLPEGTNPAYALAYKGARTFAGFAPVGGAAALTGGLSGMGGVAGMLARASPLAAAAGGDGYQAAVDAGLGEHRALQVGLAQAAVAELAGATQLGSVLSKYPWLRQGVQSLAEKRVAEYLAARGADATFQGAVGVAQLAANDAIHVASGLNPGAFENFWTEQAPAAFGENAFIAGAAGGLHDVAALPGAIRQRQQAAQLPAEYAAAREVARQTAPPNTTPAVQVRVEGPPAPVVNPNRPAPPPADGGPAAVAPPAPAGSPDQPTARVPGEGGADFSAAEALAARMAGERTPATNGSQKDVHLNGHESETDTSSTTTAIPLAEQPIKVGERVQWTSQGVAQFPEPRKVEGFATWTDGRRYAKLEGSNTMVPVEELGRPMPPKPAEPPPPPPAPRTQFTPRPPQPPREPAARPEMGSGRLNIPADVVDPAERRRTTMDRAEVRRIQNRVMNPPTRGYTTEDSLNPAEVFPQRPATKAADEAPQPEASQAQRTEEQGAQQPEPPKPSTPPQTAEGGAESQSGQPRDSGGESSPEGTPKPAPHPAASDERARVHQEVKDAFGDQGEAALPLLDAYARSWTRATGRPAGEFYGRFTFEKGGGDAGSMKQGGAGKTLPLFQNGGTTPTNKGSYRLLEDGRAVIRALDNPDPSTLPHELGHAFLDFLHEIDPKLHADAMKALGAEGEPTVENHERWSRAFEAYLREGKAPSSILRATFERFKAWLRDVYKSITRGPLAKKLTPALRQVFNEMLTRGDAPESKPREVGKRRSQPVERREWSKADLADRLEHKYTNSPTYQADLSQDHIDLDRGTAGDFSGMYRFPGKIPTELTEALADRPELLKLLKANSPGPGAVGADYLGEMGTEKYIRKLEGDTRRRTKDVVESLRKDSADPEAMFLADLWESTPKGGGAPKETVKAEDLAEQGLKFTIDGRNAAIIKKGGDLHLRVKGLGSYPLVAFDEVPVDRGSLARGARGTELHQAAQEPEKTTPKLLDAVTHLAIKTAQRGIRGLKVTERDATVALDRFIGHGEYGPAVTTRAARMANTLLRRSQNKFGGIDPARLEANIGKAYTVAKNRAHREALRQTEVGRAMEVRAMERKGEAKVEKLKTLLTEKGLQAAREMAQEKREARTRLINQADRFLKKGLKERLKSEQRGSVEGYKAGQKDLQAIRREAAKLVMNGLPRGERGRGIIIKALREATRERDIYRLIQEVQHRAVSARAGEAWKAIRKATKGKGISGLPEVADGLQPAIADGFRVRDRVKSLVKEAKVLKDVAATQKAEPVRLSRLLRQRNVERAIIKDPAATPMQKALARDVLREVNGKLRDIRPDLQPKIDAANKLAEISKEIRETRTIVKNADAAWMSNERKSARWLRQNIAGRLEQTKKISITPETKPGVEKKATQTWERQAVFQNWTPDTLGQWMDNAIGDPAKAQFAHHLLFKEPLRAAARVAEEKVQRLAGLDAISKKYGFDSFDHATAVISGTHGGGLQETVDIDVPGWTNKKITLDEALKIFGDDQDEMTRALSDDGMAHVIDRLSNGHATGLDAETRKGIIDAIPKKYRDFYAEVKEFKEKSLGGRPLEIRRRLKGSAPDMVKNREPRIRKSDSDYNHDYFDAQTGSRSLLEQGFMKDRVQNPGAVNVIVGGLENHMKDWDAQLHLIHHADLANTLAKTLIHKDTLKALEVQGGTQASKRVQALVDRILGTELKSRPTALDRAARVLRRNTGAAMTALNPRSFTKQFSVMPLLASLHPREAMAAAARLGERGLRDRVMNSNGLLAQRFHMADAAKAASAGLSNPIFDSGNFWLRMKAAGGNILDAKSQASKLQLRNATKNVMRALGNLRDGTFNALRFNSWADEQGVKLAFLINEQLVDREHPNLAKAEREQLIGERTAELCYRTMNTYDILGQSAWRSDLDQHAILGMANMFSNDGTKQANLLYQAAASGDKGLKARVAAGIGLGSAWSVLAPAAVGLLGGYAWRQIAGGSDTDIEHAKTLKKQLAWSAGREAAGKIPIVGAETLMDLFRGIAEGKNDSAGTSNPAMQSVGQLVHETSLALYNTWSDQDSPDKTDVQNFEASQKKAERRADALNSALRAGGTVAGVGFMPIISLLRAMKPEAEVYGLAAHWAGRGDEDKAADILAERVAAMQKAGLEDGEIKKHLVSVMESRLNRDVEKDDRQTRNENAATARRLVAEALNR